MDNESKFWDALGALTYAELLAVGERLRDTAEDGDFDKSRANQWMEILHWARVSHDDYVEMAASEG